MRFKLFIGIIFLGLLSISLAPALAMSGAEVTSATFYCSHVTFDYNEIFYDRDNTGSGRELYTIASYDGDGNVLSSFSDDQLVGSTSPASSSSIIFVTPPTANPITLELISHAGNGLLEQVVWSISGDCPDLPPSSGTSSTSGVSAPTMPANFVLVNITCDTPVYNTPAGAPVGEAAVTAGQTWFVNPEPVEGDDGKMWTEIFVSSYINPYIPTTCIG